jgi:peroxiredoxin
MSIAFTVSRRKWSRRAETQGTQSLEIQFPAPLIVAAILPFAAGQFCTTTNISPDIPVMCASQHTTTDLFCSVHPISWFGRIAL